jgi:hypothetical protein
VRKLNCLLVLFAAVFLLAGQSLVAAQGTANELPERFRAFAANLGNIPTTADNRQIELQIDRWSTKREADLLLSTLKERGEDALRNEMQDLPKAGWIRTQDSLAYPLRYAHQEPWGDGGRKITLMSDRYMAFWEVAGSSRTRDYPFTVVELNLKHDGKGEGSLSLATRITMEAGILVFEEYSSQPIRLLSVTKEK